MKSVYDLDVDIELNKEVNWREEPDEGDADDEELEETPANVIALLGFDPKGE